jgi:hypothetical protein
LFALWDKIIDNEAIRNFFPAQNPDSRRTAFLSKAHEF